MQRVKGVSLALRQHRAVNGRRRRHELRSGALRGMEMHGMSLRSIRSRRRTGIATSHVKARRFGIWAGLAIVAAITSGALLAQAPQAIGTWVSVGDLSSPLTNGAVVALPDKRTLIAGGALADGTLTDAVTIYDSVDDSAAAAGTLTSARDGPHRDSAQGRARARRRRNDRRRSRVLRYRDLRSGYRNIRDRGASARAEERPRRCCTSRWQRAHRGRCNCRRRLPSDSRPFRS